jgi:hypothetical protein
VILLELSFVVSVAANRTPCHFWFLSSTKDLKGVPYVTTVAMTDARIATKTAPDLHVAALKALLSAAEHVLTEGSLGISNRALR